MHEPSGHLDLELERAVQAYMWATPLVASEAVRVTGLRNDGIDRKCDRDRR